MSASAAGPRLDPYQVLCIDPKSKWSLDTVRKNYKRLALQLHPDKCRLGTEAATQVFQVLTNAYRELVAIDASRRADRTFVELKAEYMQGEAREEPRKPREPRDHKSFDVARFNTLFAEHRVERPEDAGYREWMESQPPDPSPRGPPRTTAVVRHREPEAVAYVRRHGMAYHELGAGVVDDYSKAPSCDRRAVMYTDYKVAHTTSRLVDLDPDEAIARRRTYRNVQELEKERARVRFAMNKREQLEHLKDVAQRDAREAQRLERLRDEDHRLAQHYERVNRLFVEGQKP